MTPQEEPSITARDFSARRALDPRVWLPVMLAAAMGMAVVSYRSLSTLDRRYLGPLVPLEGFPAIALIAVLALGHTRLRSVGAMTAYLAAAWLAFGSYAMASYPGGSPSTLDPSRPPPLTTPQSLFGLTIACAAVMVTASLYARGRARIAINVCTALLLSACVVVKTLIYV